ncbi:GNAT family N-acetyltransferase [Asticcacaulis sp. AC402]|uniref:GNAT family N-acetyltransferase n=1 Tax=Asticcacaulis sp. AC402 TaxID=1282361 RepID=UPI0003C404EC|nr:GNAT family N-acetyltransferase [Asticcacaulis sp. AC402]ESQ76606.1 hypothetical protein ABAC402_02730 [Asticcacaulis sp. AC402]
MKIKILRQGDEDLFERVADDLFDNPIDPALVREFLADPRHHIAVAVDGPAIVGFASGVHYVHPDKPAQLFINEVAVADHHQRRGHGSALLQALLAEGRALGCHEAWVLTNIDNAAANRLYRAAGGSDGADDSESPIVGYSFKLIP